MGKGVSIWKHKIWGYLYLSVSIIIYHRERGRKMCSVRLGRRRVKEITQTQDLWHPPDKNLNSENRFFFPLPPVSELSRPYRSRSHDGFGFGFCFGWGILSRSLQSQTPETGQKPQKEACWRNAHSSTLRAQPMPGKSPAAADDNNQKKKSKKKFFKRFCRRENSDRGFLLWFYEVSMGTCRQLPSLHLHTAI